MKILRIHIFAFLFMSMVFAQGNAGEEATSEYRYLIDVPAAGVVDKGYFSMHQQLMPDGLLVSHLDVGIFDNLSFGISYGGENVIGSGKIDWYKYPGVNVRYKFLTENITAPSLTIGFDSQGKGHYSDTDKRYERKSPGFFLAASKNYQLLGYISFHVVANYSLEEVENDNTANLMLGVEKTVGPVLSFIVDYDFAFNDKKNGYGEGNGYLNVGVRWNVGPGLTLGFDLRDLLQNKEFSTSAADRAIRLEYTQSIL